MELLGQAYDDKMYPKDWARNPLPDVVVEERSDVDARYPGEAAPIAVVPQERAEAPSVSLQPDAVGHNLQEVAEQGEPKVNTHDVRMLSVSTINAISVSCMTCAHWQSTCLTITCSISP